MSELQFRKLTVAGFPAFEYTWHIQLRDLRPAGYSQSHWRKLVKSGLAPKDPWEGAEVIEEPNTWATQTVSADR